MNERHFLFFLIFLFFLSSVWLTVRQESLLLGADQDFVSLSFTEPGNRESSHFTVTHRAASPRELTLIYRYENNQEEVLSFTLAPKEEKTFQPERKPLSITLRYQDTSNQTQEITLYNKK